MKVVPTNVKCKLTLSGRQNKSTPPLSTAKSNSNCCNQSDESMNASLVQTSIWNLPEELVIQLLKSLPIRDLLNMRLVHPAFRDLIDSNSVLYQTVCFDNEWPTSSNIKHFELAAKHNNLQALIKLGVAYLYNEGLPCDAEGKQIFANGIQAARLFCHAESLTPKIDAFTWLFIRPPWSNACACCKECVFKNMVNYVHETNDASVCMCVCRTLNLFHDEDSLNRMNSFLERAASQGSHSAMFTIWKNKYQKKVLDRAEELMIMRELRDIANLGYTPAQLALCQNYVSDNYGGIQRSQAAAFVRNFMSSSVATNIHRSYRRNKELTHSTRYILVDWLVEVASMKKFSSRTLHVAISVVDRFLGLHEMSRDRLQLVGIAAMVVCSRYLGKDIITIREAAWLTDDTYRYEDVVRMKGEVVATLKGKIQVLTIYDYLELFANLDNLSQKSRHLVEYICELIMLHCQLGCYKQSLLAGAAVMLSNIILKTDCIWSNKLQEFSGFSIRDLSKCVIHIHQRCFAGKMVDHRSFELRAVKQRYADESLSSVSEIPMMKFDELFSLVTGVNERLFCKNELYSMCSMSADSPISSVHHNNSRFNESTISGYEADREDETSSSMMEYDEEDPLIDLSNKRQQSQVTTTTTTTFQTLRSQNRNNNDEHSDIISVQSASTSETDQSQSFNIHRGCQSTRTISAAASTSYAATPVSMETSRASINWSPEPEEDSEILQELSEVTFTPNDNNNGSDSSGRHNVPGMRLQGSLNTPAIPQRRATDRNPSVKRKCSISFDDRSSEMENR